MTYVNQESMSLLPLFNIPTSSCLNEEEKNRSSSILLLLLSSHVTFYIFFLMNFFPVNLTRKHKYQAWCLPDAICSVSFILNLMISPFQIRLLKKYHRAQREFS